MRRDLENLMEAIEKTDRYLALKMWERAWNVMEDLPAHLRDHPDIIIRRIDVLTGSQQGDKALLLAEGTVAVYPERAEVWHRLARLQALAGNLEGARVAARNCVELDRDMQLEVFEDEILKVIW